MEYITSRNFALPIDSKKMEAAQWFNMWARQYFPYAELFVGDVVYWFETKSQTVRWKTEVYQVERFQYNDKSEVFSKYERPSGTYYETRPNQGYFLGYKVRPLERLSIPKPKGVLFPQLGWLKLDEDGVFEWFNRLPVEEKTTLDDILPPADRSLIDLLTELNKEMQQVSPEKVQRVVSTTIRKDTKIVQLLKRAADFKCQFPDCGHQIRKKKGGFYIEVAHVQAVHQGGQSVLGNLVVLCPNHHKEFDYGDLKISNQSASRLSGKLNGSEFWIQMAGDT